MVINRRQLLLGPFAVGAVTFADRLLAAQAKTPVRPVMPGTPPEGFSELFIEFLKSESEQDPNIPFSYISGSSVSKDLRGKKRDLGIQAIDDIDRLLDSSATPEILAEARQKATAFLQSGGVEAIQPQSLKVRAMATLQVASWDSIAKAYDPKALPHLVRFVQMFQMDPETSRQLEIDPAKKIVESMNAKWFTDFVARKLADILPETATQKEWDRAYPKMFLMETMNLVGMVYQDLFKEPYQEVQPVFFRLPKGITVLAGMFYDVSLSDPPEDGKTDPFVDFVKKSFPDRRFIFIDDDGKYDEDEFALKLLTAIHERIHAVHFEWMKKVFEGSMEESDPRFMIGQVAAMNAALYANADDKSCLEAWRKKDLAKDSYEVKDIRRRSIAALRCAETGHAYANQVLERFANTATGLVLSQYYEIDPAKIVPPPPAPFSPPPR